MKIKMIVLLAVLIFSNCEKSDKKQGKMDSKATIVEMVLFKLNEGVNLEDGKKAITSLNEFVSQQEGFISRKTSISEDGQFLDIVYWTDLQSALTASEKAMKNPATLKTFNLMDEGSMIFKHFQIFNER